MDQNWSSLASQPAWTELIFTVASFCYFSSSQESHQDLVARRTHTLIFP